VQSLALLGSQRLLEAHQLLQQHLSSAVAGQCGDVVELMNGILEHHLGMLVFQHP